MSSDDIAAIRRLVTALAVGIALILIAGWIGICLFVPPRGF